VPILQAVGTRNDAQFDKVELLLAIEHAAASC